MIRRLSHAAQKRLNALLARQVLAACAALALSAGAALAALAAVPVTAKLTAPISATTKFIAGGAIFKCQAGACVALAPTGRTATLATCKTVVGKVGPVASFGAGKPLDEARLAACNAEAVAKGAAGAQLATQ